MDWKTLARATLIRALKTFCEVLATCIGTQQIGIHELDWVQMLSMTATATVLSVLWSVAGGLPEVKLSQELDSLPPTEVQDGEL